MKRLIKPICAVLGVLLFACIFAGCGPTDTGRPGPEDAAYTVTFRYNYTGASPWMSAVEVDAGERVLRPQQDPVRTGYLFDDWYAEQACVNKFDFTALITGNVRIYAGWERDASYKERYDVTFRYNYPGANPAVISEDEVPDGASVQRPTSEPVRERYLFDDWYAEAACIHKFDFTSPVTEPVVIYAGWIQTIAKITFNLNYAGAPAAPGSVTADIGETAAEPDSPKRAGYAFTGWYTEAACINEFRFATDTLSADITLYAGWTQSEVTIKFNLNYDTTDLPPANIIVDIGQKATRPEDPERKGYDFIDWSTDPYGEEIFDFSSAVIRNLTLFAQWEIQEYNVTVHLNYDGAPAATVTPVRYGETFARPDQPAREGNYIFTGWYTDAAAQGVQYNFSTPITTAIDLYAGWTQGGGTANTYTYYWNYAGAPNQVYKTENIESGFMALKPADPVKPDSTDYFAGWFLDAAGTQKYDFNSIVTAPRDLYAKWLTRYTFEAEYTVLEDKRGTGVSDSGDGPGYLIRGENTLANVVNASNGFFVHKLNYNGAFLDFEIVSSKAVSDAVIELRLSPYLFNNFLSDEEYQVIVNGQKISYEGLSLTNVIPETGPNGEDGYNMFRPFENYMISVSVPLQEGENTIRLLTNNTKAHEGTFSAETPMVDCMYVYSDAILSWDPVTSNLIGL